MTSQNAKEAKNSELEEAAQLPRPRHVNEPAVQIVGEDFISLCENETSRTRPIRDALTIQERKKVQLAIRATIRPASHRSPPHDIGEESQGKFKADELRTATEFDIPVALAEQWAKEMRPDNDNTDPAVVERNHKKFQATMYLSMAIKYGTSFRSSEQHAQKYTEYLTAYLKLLLELYPTMELTPNQHRALHVGPSLLRFGPVPGWWMFPFERLIGIVQKLNHNFKNGKLLLHHTMTILLPR